MLQLALYTCLCICFLIEPGVLHVALYVVRLHGIHRIAGEWQHGSGVCEPPCWWGCMNCDGIFDPAHAPFTRRLIYTLTHLRILVSQHASYSDRQSFNTSKRWEKSAQHSSFGRRHIESKGDCGTCIDPYSCSLFACPRASVCVSVRDTPCFCVGSDPEWDDSGSANVLKCTTFAGKAYKKFWPITPGIIHLWAMQGVCPWRADEGFPDPPAENPEIVLVWIAGQPQQTWAQGEVRGWWGVFHRHLETSTCLIASSPAHGILVVRLTTWTLSFHVVVGRKWRIAHCCFKR